MKRSQEKAWTRLYDSSLHFLSSFFVLILLPLRLRTVNDSPETSLLLGGGRGRLGGGNSALPRQRRFSRVEITGRD